MSPTSCQTAPPRIGRGRILQIWQFDYNPELPLFSGGIAPCPLTLQQTVHGHAPVAGITGIPVRHAGIRIDSQVIETLMQVSDSLTFCIASRQVRPVRQRPFAPVVEDNLSVVSPFAAETALMHQPMMLAAQLHQVIETGLAALAPVNDVVSVHEMLACTAREPASVVAKA